MSVPLAKMIFKCRYFGVNTMVRMFSPIKKYPCQASWSQIKWYATNKNSTDKQLVKRNIFENIKNKNKETYLEMLNIYKEQEIKRRGHVEFIYAALKHMKEFGVEKDLDIYKSLIDVFPKGKMVPRNLLQAEFMHYPKQQQCAVDLLEQMEENGVIPDWNMEDQLLNIFGKRGHPLRRYWRMMYWMPKFKKASPWPLPAQVPSDAFQLAMMAIERITSVDVNTAITVFKTSDVKDSIEDTWIISAQSADQINLLQELPDETPLYVEGRFRVWLRSSAVTYFILRADIHRNVEIEEDYDDIRNLKIPFFSKPDNLPQKRPSVHEQEDGIILAVCSTGTSGRDSLLSWIRLLQKNNPRLGELPVLFTLKSPTGDDSVMTTEQTTDSEITEKLRKK